MKFHVRFRQVRPDHWVLVYREREIADVRWVNALRHPVLTMQRIVDGLNGDFDELDVAQRTWSLRVWEPLGSTTSSGVRKPVWLLLHNGLDVGEIAWRGPVANEERLMQRLVSAMNVDLGEKRPFPEPLQPRPVEQRQIARSSRAA